MADIIIISGGDSGLFYLLLWVIVWAVFGYFLAHPEQRTLGTFLSAFLGPIGLIITLILRLNRRPEAPAAAFIPSIHRQPDAPPPLPDSFLIRRGFGAAAETCCLLSSRRMSFDEAFPGVRAWLEAERGRKAQLATALAVRPHMLSAWLRNEGLPNTATTLALQQWFRQESGRCPVCSVI